MSTVSIVYYSGSGHNTKMAEAVHRGAASVPGVTANLLVIAGDDITKGRYENETVLTQLDASDAIIFGCPTYMGGPAAQFKALADATGGRWFHGKWRDKLAAGFSVSNGPSGDKLNTLHYLFSLAMQHGMIWIGMPENPMNDKGINRLSSYAGVMGQGYDTPEVTPNEADKLTGEILGKRVAAFAVKFSKA